VALATLLAGPSAAAQTASARTVEGHVFARIDESRDRQVAFLRELIRAGEQGDEAIQAIVARRFASLGCAGDTLRVAPGMLRLAEEFVAEAVMVPGQPEGSSVLVDPDAPERSAMLYRMRSRRPSRQMPPLGTVLADEQAIEAIAAWMKRRDSWNATDRVFSAR
jgi:hypothetical protein